MQLRFRDYEENGVEYFSVTCDNRAVLDALKDQNLDIYIDSEGQISGNRKLTFNSINENVLKFMIEPK